MRARASLGSDAAEDQPSSLKVTASPGGGGAAAKGAGGGASGSGET